MIERRKARQAALELLYQHDIYGCDLNAAIARHVRVADAKPIPDFALRLLNGIAPNHKVIDELIDKNAENWAIERLPLIDRNILRIAIYEMLFEPSIPYSVSINEAIELAKLFGSAESGKFINGVLGHVAVSLEEETKASSSGKKEAK